MILYERPLGVDDRLFDGRELLGDVKAWLATLDHGDDALQVPFGPLQALDDFGMRRVGMFCHGFLYPPGGDTCQYWDR
ncbi:hypothetical protein RHSP_75499 [Rhizobium freirei PRF 81]|uniref:Uncharacterized protein n=1 Tax=Rhizobium freirei PRF 81 TaxID=363754 RepID=N6U1B8_9HYPH|nr:hypothetical protein RHSP_75499 [Rhizobium freirei PRF 81]